MCFSSVFQSFLVRFSCGFRGLVLEWLIKTFFFKCSIKKNLGTGEFFRDGRKQEAKVFFLLGLSSRCSASHLSTPPPPRSARSSVKSILAPCMLRPDEFDLFSDAVLIDQWVDGHDHNCLLRLKLTSWRCVVGWTDSHLTPSRYTIDIRFTEFNYFGRFGCKVLCHSTRSSLDSESICWLLTEFDKNL